MRTIQIIFFLSISTLFVGCGGGSGGSLPIIGQIGKGARDKKGERKNKGDLVNESSDDQRQDPTQKDKVISQDNSYDTIDTSSWHAALTTRVNNGAPFGHLICSKGPEALKYTDYDDFSDLFNVVCKDGAPNTNFSQILNQSATDIGEPKVSVFRLNIEKDLYTTDFIYAFAVKVPVSSPVQLTAYPILEEMSKGLKTADSEVRFSKGKEAIFPGRGVVRSIEQSYSMPLAKGAALFDKRSTLTNTYLLAEGNNDINLVAEHLIGTAEYYNASRQLVFSLKGESPNTTYMVYLNQLIVINRFDPQRLTSAATELSQLIPQIILRTIKGK